MGGTASWITRGQCYRGGWTKLCDIMPLCFVEDGYLVEEPLTHWVGRPLTHAGILCLGRNLNCLTSSDPHVRASLRIQVIRIVSSRHTSVWVECSTASFPVFGMVNKPMCFQPGGRWLPAEECCRHVWEVYHSLMHMPRDHIHYTVCQGPRTKLTIG